MYVYIFVNIATVFLYDKLLHVNLCTELVIFKDLVKLTNCFVVQPKDMS